MSITPLETGSAIIVLVACAVFIPLQIWALGGRKWSWQRVERSGDRGPQNRPMDTPREFMITIIVLWLLGFTAIGFSYFWPKAAADFFNRLWLGYGIGVMFLMVAALYTSNPGKWRVRLGGWVPNDKDYQNLRNPKIKR